MIDSSAWMNWYNTNVQLLSFKISVERNSYFSGILSSINSSYNLCQQDFFITIVDVLLLNNGTRFRQYYYTSIIWLRNKNEKFFHDWRHHTSDDLSAQTVSSSTQKKNLYFPWYFIRPNINHYHIAKFVWIL